MKRLSVVFAATLIGALVGCGDSTTPRYNVFTAGDSLSDAGTFGYRFTVQGTESEPNRVWTELVAAGVGMTEPCARYRPSPAAAGAVEANPLAASCGGYAVAGASLLLADPAANSTPYSVLQQIRTIARERRPLGSRDLLLMSGGANDAAEVFERWLRANANANALPAYQALMAQLLSPAAIGDLSQPNARANAGLQYMAKLADKLADTLRDEVLANGASRVVVTNIPDIARTPKLRAVLAGLALSPNDLKDTSDFGAALATAFNQQLANRLAADSRVILYDLFGALNAWISDPPPEFSNALEPACPRTNPNDLAALPTYAISQCTAARLSAAAGGSPNAWQSYLFADDFHPTPRGHSEASKQILQLIRARGWN